MRVTHPLTQKVSKISSVQWPSDASRKIFSLTPQTWFRGPGGRSSASKCLAWKRCSSTGVKTHLTRAAWLWNLHSPHPHLKSCYKHWEKCGPSVAADGDLWTVYKLQPWNQWRCPKYVIQIGQSEWQGEHYLVRVPHLTNLRWRMGPSRGYGLVLFPRSPMELVL